MGNRRKFLILAAVLFALGILLIWSGSQVINELPSSEPSSYTLSPAPSKEVLHTVNEVLVTRVVDGDTIEIEGEQKVRYIGIDTPETVDPRRAVGCFGKEASVENKRLVEGKRVNLVKDISETDKFGRLLRYVYVDSDGQTIFVNDYLVRFGFAKASTYPPDVKFASQFLEAEREASVAQRGLWQKCI